MNNILLIIGIVLILLAISLFIKFKSKTFAKFRFKRKNLVLAFPNKLERVLLFLYLFFFFIADLAQNKVIDLGTDYKVTVFWHTKALALDVWIVFLILFHIILVSLFLMSLRSKATSHYFDIIVGIIGLFGVAILTSGVIVQIFSQTIHFLFMNLKSIDFYHIGVYIEILVGLYYTLSK